MIAGHTFIDTMHGRICECGRRWADIASVTRDDIGKPDIAHEGSLTENEYNSIIDERNRCWDALVGVASGR